MIFSGGSDHFSKERKHISALRLSKKDFDSDGDFHFPCEGGETQERGRMTYEQQSSNWLRVGLSVFGKYDGGNNDWLAMDGKKANGQ